MGIDDVAANTGEGQQGRQRLDFEYAVVRPDAAKFLRVTSASRPYFARIISARSSGIEKSLASARLSRRTSRKSADAESALDKTSSKLALYAHHGEVRLTSAGRAEWVIRHRLEPTGTSATVAETMPPLNVPSACSPIARPRFTSKAAFSNSARLMCVMMANLSCGSLLLGTSAVENDSGGPQ